MCNIHYRCKQADKAISSIKPGHIQEVKKLPNPADVIKMVFDCILLLFHLPVRSSIPVTASMLVSVFGYFLFVHYLLPFRASKIVSHKFDLLMATHFPMLFSCANS